MAAPERRDSLWAADVALAVSVADRHPARRGRRARCSTCGLLFARGDLVADVNEDGKRTGWVCFGCY